MVFRSELDQELQADKAYDRTAMRDRDVQETVRAKENLQTSKAYFLATTGTRENDARIFELCEKIQCIVTDQTGLQHMRTRWGLRFGFVDSQQAAANFDKDPRPTSFERKMEDATPVSKADDIAREASDSYGIHFRALGKSGWMHYTIQPTGYPDSFKIEKVDERGFHCGNIGNDVRRGEDTIEFVRDVMKDHIELQRSPLRLAFHAGSAVAAPAVAAMRTLGFSKPEFNIY